MTSSVTISVDSCHVVAFRQNGLSSPGLESFLQLAADVGVPAEFPDDGMIDTEMLAQLARKIGVPSAHQKVKTVLLCGGYLEEQVSLAAQVLLATGYPVYLLRELIVSKQPEHAHIHDLRLVQAGATPTTVAHLIYEWLATETDEDIHNVLSRSRSLLDASR